MLTIEGKIVNHDAVGRGRIEIDPETGLIKNVTSPEGKADIVLGDECLIFPGFGDMHIHAREDQSGKWNYKEDFTSASKAAIHGGVTFAMDMTNNPIPLVSEAAYLERKKLEQEKSLIDIVLAAPIGPNTKPFSFPVPYKLFMTHSVGDLFFTSKAQIEEAVARYKGQAISFHCEDPEVLEKYKNETSHEKRRPAEAEISGIEFALQLIEKYNIAGRICHLSTKAGLEKVIEVKNKGLEVICEVTPHHLYFDDTMGLQMNPPLRSKADRLALLEGLKRGDIDFLASDHAPHSKEEKLQGLSGVPQLDTYGPFTTWLMAEHGFAPQDIARVCAYNPGTYIQPFLSKDYGQGFGQIKPGFMASLTVIDTSKKAHILEEKLQTKAGWTPFKDLAFAGSVKYAIIRSRVYENTSF